MAIESAATNWDPAFLGLFLLLFAAVAIFAGAFPQGDRRWWTLLALLALLVVAGTLLPDGWAGGSCWMRPRSSRGHGVEQRNPGAARAGRTYLTLLIFFPDRLTEACS